MYHRNPLPLSQRKFSRTIALFAQFEAQGLFFKAPSFRLGLISGIIVSTLEVFGMASCQLLK
jgi:hypothetical protein